MRNTRLFVAICVLFLTAFCVVTVQAKSSGENASNKRVLLEAIDEIQAMIDEVNAAEKKHERVFGGAIFPNMLFMKCYYRKAGIPEEEFGKSVYRVGGEYGVSLSEISDISWLQDSIGEVRNGESVIRPDSLLGMTGVLKASMNFLQDNSDYYLAHPPVAEMNYLRKGMNKWRDQVAEYHNLLDEYFTSLGEFIKYLVYYRDKVWSDKNKALDEKYAGRENNKALAAKYAIEKKELDRWHVEMDAKAGAFMADLESNSRIRQRIRELADNEKSWPFTDLGRVFSDRIEISKHNEDYIKYKNRLKEIDPNGMEAKRIKEVLPDKEKEIKKLIKAAEKKYGRNWKDRFRDPKTGALPGGFLRDSGVDALKVMYNKHRGEVFFPIGGIKKETPKEELLQDKLYEFLGRCEGSSLESAKEEKSPAKQNEPPLKTAETPQESGIQEEESPSEESEIPEQEAVTDCRGRITGVWETNWGKMILKETSGSVSGAYDQDIGRIYHGSLKKNILKGVWGEEEADRKCSSAYKGREYWGCLTFEFNKDCNKFKGPWDYCCDKTTAGEWTGEKVRALTAKDKIVCSTDFTPTFYRRYSVGQFGSMTLYRTAISPGSPIESTDDGLLVEVKEIHKHCPNKHDIKVTTVAKVSSLRGEETRRSEIIIGQKHGIETGPGGEKLDAIAKAGGIMVIGKDDFVPGSTVTVTIQIGCPGDDCDVVNCRKSRTYTFPVKQSSLGTRIRDFLK